MNVHIHQGLHATTVSITMNGNFPHNSTAKVLAALAKVYPRQALHITADADEGATQNSVTGDDLLFLEAVKAAYDLYVLPPKPEPTPVEAVWK